MGELLGGGAQKSQGGAGNLLTALPSILTGFKGVDTKAQSDIAGKQANVADAIYNPSNPLYQQLYGQQKQNIQQNAAANIAQAGNQNRLLSSMGRTPLFSPERNGEQAFRQSVMAQQAADTQAQDQTRGILSGGLTGLGQAMTGANQRSAALYGPSKVAQGSRNQMAIGFDSIGQYLNGTPNGVNGNPNNGSPFLKENQGTNSVNMEQLQKIAQYLKGGTI